MTRSIDPVVAEALDELAPGALPRFRIACEPDEFTELAAEAVQTAPSIEGWLLNWLVHDIGFLARLYWELTGADRLAISLSVVDDDSCRYFHADNVGSRLVTTYRGPGTQWVDTAYEADRFAVPAEAIRDMERGWIAVLRGLKGAGLHTPAVLHRSPPITGTGIARLFLAIDEAPCPGNA